MPYRLLVLLFLMTLQARPMMGSDVPAQPTSPVLVELFTSEGCSSCPPADALLLQLDRSGSAIVLSEHVDYWNQLGWKDPYSSYLFSERQTAYVRRFGLKGPYTPQMVVDGGAEFLGSDARQAGQAILQARRQDKIPVRIASLRVDGTKLRVLVEADALPPSAKKSEVYLALALSHAESAVTKGENAGRQITHAGVVRTLVKAGSLGKDKSFAKEVQLSLKDSDDLANLRIVAFVQETGAGRVLGSAAQPVRQP